MHIAEKMVAKMDDLFYNHVGISAEGDRQYYELRDDALELADNDPIAREIFAAAGLPV